MTWRLHWLEAEGDLTPRRHQIASEIATARCAVAGNVATPPLDILVQRCRHAVIPRIGMGGRAHRDRLLAISLDPDNPNFANSLANGAIRRTVTHEVHHCLRMAGPGYGRTLGEALVSEGLAGHFTRRLFATLPEPWECAVDEETVRSHHPSPAELSSSSYDHRAWFFGHGGHRPRWLGYTLGHHLVGRWLERTGPVDGSALINVAAEIVLANAEARTTRA